MNSLMNIPNTAKSNRLHGERFSFKEIRHLQEKKKCHSMKYSDNQRIIIGMNDIQQLILIDGRHLLEAHRKLYKIVPKYLV